MPKRERFVAGIYNYCDRWCERCRFTDRCRVHRDCERQRRRSLRRGQDPDDLDTALEDVSRNFEKVGRMLARWSKANHIDLDKLAAEAPKAELVQAARESDVDRDSLVVDSVRYMELCRDVLKEIGPALNEGLQGAKGRSRFMDVDGEARVLRSVRDAFDVVSWYHTMVHVKLRRAVSGRVEAELAQAEHGDDECDYHLHDAAGSAHVARKGLMRSKAALTCLYDWNEGLRDRIIDLLALAGRMQRTIEKTIPGVIDFTWPPPEALEEPGQEEGEA